MCVFPHLDHLTVDDLSAGSGGRHVGVQRGGLHLQYLTVKAGHALWAKRDGVRWDRRL